MLEKTWNILLTKISVYYQHSIRGKLLAKNPLKTRVCEEKYEFWVPQQASQRFARVRISRTFFGILKFCVIFFLHSNFVSSEET